MGKCRGSTLTRSPIEACGRQLWINHEPGFEANVNRESLPVIRAGKIASPSGLLFP